MGTVTTFNGTRREDRRLLTCGDCGSSTFKIVKRGASEIPIVECANCECQIMGATVNV